MLASVPVRPCRVGHSAHPCGHDLCTDRAGGGIGRASCIPVGRRVIGMSSPARVATGPEPTGGIEVLTEVERRVLWLSTAIVDHANRVRPNPSGLKVGGHQASSASMVSIMTSLWFEELTAADR